ncbi:MAG: quinone oxidoreductase [Rhodospirillaceae bacterium]|nr:quinone oxidoreductase [Rhodospirillaceae bacterium]
MPDNANAPSVAEFVPRKPDAMNNAAAAPAYAMAIAEPGGPDGFRRIAAPVADPGAGELLIRHTAIGVNFVDIYMRSGLYPWPVTRDLVTGAEAAGIIEKIGEGVSGFAPGDRVAYTLRNGAYATHRVIDAAQVVAIPDGVSDETAAASVLKGLTARYLIHDSYAANAGDTVLVHAAAGGVGLILGQWLAQKGVKAIGTAGGPEKCALAKANGYVDVIDYRTTDFVARINSATDGLGVSAVYDSVGHDTVTKSLRCLRRHGTLVSFGQSSGPALDFQINDLATGSFRLVRPSVYHYTCDRTWLEQAAADLFSLVAVGTIRIAINQTWPLDRVAEAHKALEGRQTSGSTILTVGRPDGEV